MQKKRRKKRQENKKLYKYIPALVALFVIVIGIVISVKRYAPVNDHIDLRDYYVLKPGEIAIIYNGHYDYKKRPEIPQGIEIDGVPFIELSYLKSHLDDGYVYDDEEDILRYVIGSDVVSVKAGELSYTMGRDTFDYQTNIIVENDDGDYINLDFVRIFTDFNYTYTPAPNRLTIETAGTKQTLSELSKDTAMRKSGGPKSPILKDALKGERLQILEDYGRWSKCLSEDGVIGCVKNSTLKKKQETVVANNLPKREYNHNLLNKPINMAWHQVTTAEGNSSLDSLVGNTSGLNVISPTWYKIADNSGNIKSISSLEYVNKCHDMGLEVWGLVSNIDTEGVDSTVVLSRTSSRDNLINSIVAAAIADNLDGINIDFEALSIEARDGFLEFIREISIKCKSNDIILSVDNYKVEDFNAFYNRKEQAKYADYIVVMAYDEHHGASDKAGSNSSLPFVKEAVSGTLNEVPANQVILALPFYTRIWSGEGDELNNKSMGMEKANKLSEEYGGERVWLSKEEQYYLKYENDGVVYETWLEDEESLSRKLALIPENSLAGAAFWKLGFEPGSIWGVIANYIK